MFIQYPLDGQYTMKRKRGTVFLFKLMLFAGISCKCSFLTAQNKQLDSLLITVNDLKNDSTKANTLNAIAAAYNDSVKAIKKSVLYSSEALILSKKLNYKKGIAHALLNNGIFYTKSRDMKLAIDNLKKALLLMVEIGDKTGEAMCYQYIGKCNDIQGNFDDALASFFTALKIAEKINNQTLMCKLYISVGKAYTLHGNLPEALKYILKVLKIQEKSTEQSELALAYSYMGHISYNQRKLDEALMYYKKSENISEKKNDKGALAGAQNNIGNCYLNKTRYKEAQAYFLKALANYSAVEDNRGIAVTYGYLSFASEKKTDQSLFYALKSIKIAKHYGFKLELAYGYNNAGNIYEEKKDYKNALIYYDQQLNVAKEIDYKLLIRDAYQHYASVYTKQKEFEQALHYTELYNVLKDSLLNKENLKQVSELNIRYETDKKEKEILLLTKDQQLNAKIIKQQQLVRWGLIGGLGLLSISIFSIYRRYCFKQKANVLLEKQKEEIQQKNILITDSIDYAKTIQEAVLPTEQEIKKRIPEFFILYKPKAIVSGDFYWLTTNKSRLLCAVADCTGHGVPGAFMSLLGYNMLEDVVKTLENPTPGILLDALNQQVIQRFSGDEEDRTVKHGMDISLISIDEKNNHLEFAGAHHPLYIVRDLQLIELKGDAVGIGTDMKHDRSFKNHVFELKKGDMIYLFTDGFPDQIGGPQRKKFYYRPFKEMLAANSMSDMEQQKEKLAEAHVDWLSGRYDQTDDILIMGIRY
jgi:serine phosphatase RsbU (regulator of sigma subunit)